MNKTILITIGVIIFALILGVWAYLFTFGTPKNVSDVFTNFGNGKTQDSSTLVDTTRIDTEPVTKNGRVQALKQISTRPVAGAGFTQDGIRYVEQGTGHVYDIHLDTGEETLMSGTTIPGTRRAIFSENAEFVAITMQDNNTTKTIVGSLAQGAQFSGKTLPSNATQVAFSKSTGTILYSLQESLGTVGYSYNLERDTTTRLFALPLRDVRMLWGNPAYVFTTPTSNQRGYIYRIEKSDLHYVTEGGRGLMAFSTPDQLVITSNSDTSIQSLSLDTNGNTMDQALPLIPEKCAVHESALYCGVPKETLNSYSFPDVWYKGITSYTDVLWSISLSEGKAVALVDFIAVSGRAIDIAKIGTDTTGQKIYFINKNDNTLWIFDTAL